ncbi:DUF1573 domain-containing protein [Ginsengibacter hankyongi]|uniref:DUF1573 domain-containing protein n=1 Tax=Ginsengibacter hankyongi TaxID=2607284 RepID=A0A5J5ILC4_9BACT|nr:DUF1573 domain-containing protein [Ginsengibacter hankyongi]KAA9040664.1 DUF1573 domain-containing protein [Ginsengibacter hankyongi]
MNRLIACVCITIMFISCNIRNTRNKPDALVSNATAQFTDSTTVQLIDSAYNFGSVTDGDKVEYSYRFRNTGNHPLIVASAMASCGCTVPEKPEEPIKPGETGFLKVVFNSKGRVGDVHKTITVTSNAYPSFPLLELTGKVVPADK